MILCDAWLGVSVRPEIRGLLNSILCVIYFVYWCEFILWVLHSFLIWNLIALPACIKFKDVIFKSDCDEINVPLYIGSMLVCS